GGAKELGMIGRDEPVTRIVARIVAETIRLIWRRKRAPQIFGRPQRAYDLLLREITQPQPAALARRVLEIEGLTAILALEEFHVGGENARVVQRKSFSQNFTGKKRLVNITLSSGTCCKIPISTSDCRNTASACGSKEPSLVKILICSS